MQEHLEHNNFQDEFDVDQLEKTINQYDWQNIDQCLATVPENKYYQVQIPDNSTSIYYLRFRYILQHQHTHFLPATLALCTFLIKSSTNNYYALMLRKKIINHQIKQLANNDDEKGRRALLQLELKFMNNLLEDNAKEYHVWTYKKDVIYKVLQNCQEDKETIKDKVYADENKFIFSLLIQDFRNYHAWDYRFWLVSYLGKMEEELVWIDDLISEHSGLSPQIVGERGQLSIKQLKINWLQVNSLWSHRFNLIRYMRQHDLKLQINKKALVVQELKSTIILLKANRKNQPLWNYLSGLVKIIHQQQKQSSTTNELENSLSLLFNPAQIHMLEVQHMNRFQLAFLKKNIKHFSLSNQNQIKLWDKILNQLKTIDKTREKYYDYLIMTKGK